jgi:hypothetical protein
VREGGVNSGFMIAQVTAAALVSRTSSWPIPASVDSIPTSANQEDHVSMATHGARRLTDMAENAANVLAIELLAGAQGIDFLRPLRTSEPLERVMSAVRERVAPYDRDRFFAPDIAAIDELVRAGAFRWTLPGGLGARHERPWVGVPGLAVGGRPAGSARRTRRRAGRPPWPEVRLPPDAATSLRARCGGRWRASASMTWRPAPISRP